MTEWRRTIACKDAFGRDGALTVLITESGEIAIGTPLNGYAVLTYSGVDLLRAAAADAQMITRRRGNRASQR